MVLVTKNIDLSTITYPATVLSTKDPIRSILISNLAAANITFVLGESVGVSTDTFVVPPSTEWDSDIFELWDEDYHYVVLKSGPATGTVNIQYKASLGIPAFFGGPQAKRGNFAG
jgi:hypothetical protein